MLRQDDAEFNRRVQERLAQDRAKREVQRKEEARREKDYANI